MSASTDRSRKSMRLVKVKVIKASAATAAISGPISGLGCPRPSIHYLIRA